MQAKTSFKNYNFTYYNIFFTCCMVINVPYIYIYNIYIYIYIYILDKNTNFI